MANPARPLEISELLPSLRFLPDFLTSMRLYLSLPCLAGSPLVKPGLRCHPLRLPISLSPMSDLVQFERQVQAKLLATERQRKVYQQQLSQRTSHLLQRSIQYRQRANELLEAVLQPRVEKVLALLGDGQVEPAGNVGRYSCTCYFSPAGRFPSTTRLELGVSHDSQFEQLLLLYDLEILPVPFVFEGSVETAFPLAAVDPKRAIAWVDERLLRFVDTYIRLRETDLPAKASDDDVFGFAA
jgi:hypothetical protein